jgi:hypothetical protein
MVHTVHDVAKLLLERINLIEGKLQLDSDLDDWEEEDLESKKFLLLEILTHDLGYHVLKPQDTEPHRLLYKSITGELDFYKL